MLYILEQWIGERVQINVETFPPNISFEGKLESVDADSVLIHQDSGVYTIVALRVIVAAHRMPSVALVKPQLEIPGGVKRAN